MNRRALLASAGAGVAGLSAGCLGGWTDAGSDPPRLVGLQVGNWHPEPQTLNVHIRADEEVLYENRIQLPGGDPSAYDRPSRNLEDHPSELPASATLSTWLESQSRDRANTVDLGDHPYEECIGVQIDVCPDCERQKGQAEVTAPDTPGLLVLSTSSCSYPG